MATTAIWDIKGRIDKVLRYAINPEKTTEQAAESLAALHVIDNVMEYAANDMKTERRCYVTGINCDEDAAAKQFVATKRHWDKTDGIVAYHGYQSFKAGEVTAESAHRIGVELASRLWGDRFEVLVATHLNTGHYHNHFVLNSVSFVDGRKYNDCRETYRELRRQSDELCREHGLSVIDSSGGSGKNYGEWLAERNGKPTRRSLIRDDIDRAIAQSTTRLHFVQALEGMGYELKLTGVKYPGLKPPGAKGFFRFHKLGEQYTPEAIKERIGQNARRQFPLPGPTKRRASPRQLRGSVDGCRRVTGLRALYFYYCYLLHIIRKRPASVKRVPFSVREDLRQLDKLDAQVRLLGRNHICTTEELAAYKGQLTEKLSALTAERTTLRSALRHRAGDGNAAPELQAQSVALTKELRELRREVRLCEAIEARTPQLQDNLNQLKQENKEREELSENEHIQRDRRSGRANDPERR